jgi:hypothetical protein
MKDRTKQESGQAPFVIAASLAPSGGIRTSDLPEADQQPRSRLSQALPWPDFSAFSRLNAAERDVAASE